MNRRSFLLRVPPALALPAARPGLTALLYDTRHPAARDFAARMADSGVAAFPTEGHALPLWYGALGDLFRRDHGRIAGLTAYADLVIARAWGRDHGLRLTLQSQTPPLFHWVLQPR